MVKMEKRIAALEESMRVVLSNQFQILKMQTRYYKKMMEGFKAIERAFKTNCNKQIEMNELLEDYSSTISGPQVYTV